MADVTKTDIVKLWVLTKLNLAKSQGIYKLADGSAAKIKGVTLPQLTYSETSDIQKFWSDMGAKLAAHLTSTGRNDLAVQMHSKNVAFLFEVNNWRFWIQDKYGNQKYQGRYLFMPAVYEFDKVVTDYVTWISTIQWSIDNVETMWERALNSISNPVARGAFAGAVKTAEFGMALPGNIREIGGGIQKGFLFTRDMLKWGAISGGLFMLYWYVLRPSDKRKTRSAQ